MTRPFASREHRLEADATAFPVGRLVPFVRPGTATPLHNRGDALADARSGEVAAPIIDGIPRFVPRGGEYAASFGWQWKKWAKARSDAHNNDTYRRKVILDRTKFASYDLRGRTLLECGCGAGNDTEILLQLPLAEIHSFDLSSSVELLRPMQEAQRNKGGPRLVLSQASITEIPYPDRSFDVVYCHRVLQHTPDPEASLRAICRKVKPGGLLFAHVYIMNSLMARHWRYKFRPLAKRLPRPLLAKALDLGAPALHALNHWLRRKGRMDTLGFEISHRYVPFIYTGNLYDHLGRERQLDLEKLQTFDTLTAWHEHPMEPERFRGIIESEGFTIDHFMNREGEPLYATARLTREQV